jgi:ankyrin
MDVGDKTPVVAVGLADQQENHQQHQQQHAVPQEHHRLTGALLRAAYEGDIDKVRTLLQEGVPVDSTNSAGLQALHFAAKSGHLEVACELLNKGASINAVSLKGHTSLHVASLLGQREIVKLLLRRGADVNLKSHCFDDTFTPLYMAAQIGHQEIVTLLLAHGADPTVATKNGSTPRDIATQQGYRALAELLAEYERRLANGGDVTDQEHPQPGPAASATADDDGQSAGGCRVRAARRPPAVYNRDVIPSPRNSPMKCTASLDQYIRSSTAAKPN